MVHDVIDAAYMPIFSIASWNAESWLCPYTRSNIVLEWTRPRQLESPYYFLAYLFISVQQSLSLSLLHGLQGQLESFNWPMLFRYNIIDSSSLIRTSDN